MSFEPNDREEKSIYNKINDQYSPKAFSSLQNKTIYEENDSNVRFRDDISTSNKPNFNRKIVLNNPREFSQTDSFVDQFIKPEIKDCNTSPCLLLKRRASRKQIYLNLLIIGESGLGQNTFIQSLTVNNIIQTEKDEKSNKIKNKLIGVGIYEKSFQLMKDGTKITLNIINVPEYGFGLQSDSTFKNILEYVNGTFKDCFKLECSLDRSSTEDRRIHCCLYFISPYGHSIKPLDIEFMKLFQSKFNIIPVIAKSDIFTRSELKIFKTNILNDFETHKINLFNYYSSRDSFDEDTADIVEMCEELKMHIPLTIISTNDMLVNNKKNERVRRYPWGSLKTDENSHFKFLENVLLKSHTNYFKMITKLIHYENFRVQYILDRVN